MMRTDTGRNLGHNVQKFSRGLPNQMKANRRIVATGRTTSGRTIVGSSAINQAIKGNVGSIVNRGKSSAVNPQTRVSRGLAGKVTGNQSSKILNGSTVRRIIDRGKLNSTTGPFKADVFKGIKNPAKDLKLVTPGSKLSGLVKDLTVKVPGGMKILPFDPGKGNGHGHHGHDHHGHHHHDHHPGHDHHGHHHHDHHPGHHHHGHHHHHKPWIVISWTPGFYVPPVCPCPEPPVVVCPPPATTCPPPVEVPVIDPALPAPAEEEALASGDAVPAPAAPDDEKTAEGATELAEAEQPKADDAKQSTDIDLQVEYVQLVEAGDSEKELGPLYRVWVVNNGAAAITKPFDVVLVATNEDAPSQDAPYAAERVAEIGAGQRLSVEIRLPVDVMQLSVDAEGLPVPFKNLFAAADVQQELTELNEQNNALGVARTNVPDASMVAAVN
jgi:hypothetical protein